MVIAFASHNHNAETCDQRIIKTSKSRIRQGGILFAYHYNNAFLYRQPLEVTSTQQQSIMNQLLISTTDNDIIKTSSITSSATPTTVVFEPIVPEDLIVTSFISTFVVCIIAGWVWANQVVPVSRTKLALSKRSGPVREYLDELRMDSELSLHKQNESPDNNSSKLKEHIDTLTTQSSTTDIIHITLTTTVTEHDNNIRNKSNTNRAFERWLFTDWLQNTKNNKNSHGQQSGRKKEPALPILRKAKWNSGDNPVLVAFALIMAGVVVTSFTERLLTAFH